VPDRIIKKYPNRRLYDTDVSRYVTLEDIRRLVKDGGKFRVVDARTDDDITRTILLQIILEQEERGQPIFTTDLLQQIIRSYGNTMQGFMSSYLQESLDFFVKQQKLMQEQMEKLMQNAPMTVFSRMAQRNLDLWKAMQEGWLKSYGAGVIPPPVDTDATDDKK
jgi:polyhydroxyalkanoate synthesis repressor PhaR